MGSVMFYSRISLGVYKLRAIKAVLYCPASALLADGS